MNQTNKSISKFTKTYSSSKLINSGEQPIQKNKNELVSDKKEINNASLNCFNTDNNSNKNMKNLNKKKTEESSSKNTKKLPKIIKYTIQINTLMDSKCGVLSNTKRTLSGKKIVVTAGGTIAPIDPVRFIGNRSTGKMGFAVAKEAVSRGANVVLVTGVSHLKDIPGAKTVRVETTEEMRTAVLAEYDNADAVIKSAAVADYRLEEVATEKIKKKDGEFVLKLVRNPDILKELGEKKKNQILVGFAAETEKLTEYANKKLVEKNLDFIVANNVKSEGAGFGTDTNIAKLMFRDGRVIDAPIMEKSELAKIILDEVESLMK